MSNKYHAIRVTVDGIKFDSLGEAEYYRMLKAREHAGGVKILGIHDKVYLTRAKILYKPDFTVLDTLTSTPYWVDYKGMETPSWRIKKKLWLHYGPGPLHVVHAKTYRLEIIDPATLKRNG